MNLLTAEQDIIARLTTVFKDIDTPKNRSHPKIESFPRDPAQFYEALRPEGAILVRYESSIYEPPEPNRNKTIVQDRTASWIISIVHRGLIDHDGVYAKMANVRTALTGYSLSDYAESTVLYPVSDRFVEEVGGVWHYEIVFQHTIPET